MGDKFLEDKLTNSSEFIDKTITNWLQEVSVEQREKFLDTLFEILGQTKAVSYTHPTMSAIILIILSTCLTIIGGIIPSKKAAKEDPVMALRAE